MSALRGFGITFDFPSGRARSWYIDSEGAKRWADNDELVQGVAGQHDDASLPPHKEGGDGRG